MNKSSALELLELMERFAPAGGAGYNGISVATNELYCCTNIAETFEGVNSNLRDSWLEVVDTCSKLHRELWIQISGVWSAINQFCQNTTYNEDSVVTAAQKTNESSQQALRELGL